MTKHEQQMLDMGCPDCGGEIELYDTNANGMGGRYRCKQCPRDTVWAVGKAMSMMEVIQEMRGETGDTHNTESGEICTEVDE